MTLVTATVPLNGRFQNSMLFQNLRSLISLQMTPGAETVCAYYHIIQLIERRRTVCQENTSLACLI